MNLTQKQVYYHWARLNEEVWRLDDDQLTLANKVLDREAGKLIEKIPIAPETGISCLAFTFIDIVNEYGKDTEEVSIDSTCEFLTLIQ